MMTCARQECGKEFTPCQHRQRYCSPGCRIQVERAARPGRPGRIPGMPTQTTGAVSEMAAAIDLLKRGYEVFRALSSACSCDLIALGPAGALRIEVRTGSRSPATGVLIFPRNGKKRGRGEDVLDHYAVVVGYGAEIIYVPELPAAPESPCAAPG